MIDPEFTLTFQRDSAGVVVGAAAYRLSRDGDLGEGAPVSLHFDRQSLLEVVNDPAEYGRRLTQMVFPESSALTGIWLRVERHGRLRVRIRLDDDIELQQICWETLFDPSERQGVPLGHKPHIWLSRTIRSDGTGRAPASFHGERSALLIVASPRNLDPWLAPINTAEQEQRLRAILPPGLTLQVLGGRESQPRASLQQIGRALMRGPLMVYLICHGSIHQDGAKLVLEEDSGTQVRVSASLLVEQLYRAPVDRRPLLMILGSCMSAGGGPMAATATALGPLLIRAQVPAVIGMQGLVQPELVHRFVAESFAGLFQHGSVDRAVAEARAGLASRDDWWQPVLYSRLPGGQLFTRAATAPAGAAKLTARQILERDLLLFEHALEEASEHCQKLTACKAIHDELHDLTYSYAVLAETVARKDLKVREHISKMGRGVEHLAATVGRASFLKRYERDWVAEIAADIKLFRLGSPPNWDELSVLLVPIESALNTRLPQFTMMLKTLASNFSLQTLLEVLVRLRPQLAGARVHDDLALELVRNPEELQRLYSEVDELIKAHDGWQEVVLQLDRIINDYEWRQQASASALPRRARLEHQLGRAIQLCQGMHRWLQREQPDQYAQALSEKLDEFSSSYDLLAPSLSMLPSQDNGVPWPADVSSSLADVKAAAGLCFFYVDTTLRDRCEGLSEQISKLAFAAVRMQVSV